LELRFRAAGYMGHLYGLGLSELGPYAHGSGRAALDDRPNVIFPNEPPLMLSGFFTVVVLLALRARSGACIRSTRPLPI
jgi:hypothetical protein